MLCKEEYRQEFQAVSKLKIKETGKLALSQDVGLLLANDQLPTEFVNTSLDNSIHHKT